jgi:outer membrane protein assembly factor BamB
LAALVAITASSAASPAGATARGPARVTLASTPWPMALCDPQHTATSTATGPTSANVLWTRSLGANITPGPVVGADGTVYVATNGGVLHAIDPATGADVWTYDAGSAYGDVDLSTSPAILSSGTILWPGPDHTLLALTADGHLLWRESFASQVLSPVVAHGSVYLEQANGTMSALDIGPNGPSVRWSLHLGATSYGSPVVAPDGAIVTTVDRQVVAVRDQGSHGEVAWRFTVAGAIEVSAAVARHGTIVVGANASYQYGLHPDGTLAWKVTRPSETYSSPSVSPDGLAYWGANNGELHVARSGTGRTVHTLHGAQGLWGAQAVDRRGDVYFGTQGSRVYGYGPHGHLLFSLPVSGPVDSYPALTGQGTLVIGDQHGTLYAVGR